MQHRPVTRALFALVGLAVTLLAASFVQGTEVRAGKRLRAIENLGDQVHTVDPNHLDPELEGELVRVEGLATGDRELVDPVFGVRTPGLLLSRQVEMWLWMETPTGSYRQGWSDTLFSSSKFAEPEGHENPSEPRLPPLTLTVPVSVGEFSVPENLVRTIQKWQPVVVTSLDGLAPELRDEAAIRDGEIRIGADPDTPQVGDLRVSFEVVPALRIKLLGRQEGRTLVHFGSPKQPHYLIMKIEDAPLFPNLENITPGQIWMRRGVSFLALAAGLALLGAATPPSRRPGVIATLLLALSAISLVAAAVWPEYSVTRGAVFGGLALVSLAAALLIQRRGLASTR